MTLSAQLDQNAIIIGTDTSQTIIMPGGPVIDTGSDEQLINAWPKLLLQNIGSNPAYITVVHSTSGALAPVAAVVNSVATAIGQRSFALKAGGTLELEVDRFYAYISLICVAASLTNVTCSRLGGTR